MSEYKALSAIEQIELQKEVKALRQLVKELEAKLASCTTRSNN